MFPSTRPVALFEFMGNSPCEEDTGRTAAAAPLLRELGSDASRVSAGWLRGATGAKKSNSENTLDRVFPQELHKLDSKLRSFIVQKIRSLDNEYVRKPDTADTARTASAWTESRRR